MVKLIIILVIAIILAVITMWLDSKVKKGDRDED